MLYLDQAGELRLDVSLGRLKRAERAASRERFRIERDDDLDEPALT